MSASPHMPALFLGHGSPMNALERNRYSAAWRAVGAQVPRPRAILMVSAHGYINATAVTAMARPKTIHDFYGFPKALFDVQYPAPGLPELAEEVADVVHPEYVGADRDSWGLDHGTWSVLVHAFPDADIPVVQLSINAAKPPEYHLALGARLAALRDRGVLVMGSGNVVHNLRAIDWNAKDEGFDWARRFNKDAIAIATSTPGNTPALMHRQDFLQVAPTPEHFLPFLYVAGFGAETNQPLDVVIDGYAYGSLSMTCFSVGMEQPASQQVSAGAADLGSNAPPENANI
ncbi:4,5-DOPA dioxygenase extradiol [Lysobacter sp. A6]|uniref:4,5-DOPA dioxygenase extradiol n=1 Tax=Noviluteimonas lactosilytica TaxID=2888523 RepID=A0ABS8JDJ6_9GAMM|nr:4,5-DOPA dioxygenase extradiol [Lysobacter lactosilyticus]MCC8361615.1 4,5-DOPA dioxygenase extradiol [Lysobacter lactosilyticus]